MFRHIFGTFGVNVANIFLGVGYSIATTRILGTDGKGEFAIFTASVGLFALLLSLGAEAAVNYFVARKQLSVGRTLSTLMLQTVLAGVFFFGVLMVASELGWGKVFLLPPNDGLACKLLLTGSLVAQMGYTFISSLLRAHRLFNALNVVNLLAVAIPALVFTFFLLAAKFGGMALDVQGVYTVHFILTSLNLAIVVGFYAKQVGIPPAGQFISREDMGMVVRWGLVVFLANMTQFFNYRLDFWFVEHFHGKTVLGVYSIAYGLSMMFRTLPTSISAVLFSYVASKEARPSTAQVLRLARISLYASMLVALVSLPMLPWVVPALYGEQFWQASYQLMIIYIGLVPMCLTSVLSSYLGGIGRVFDTMRGSLIALVVTIVADSILIPPFAAEGAAWASGISYFANAAFILYCFKKQTGCGWSEIFVPRLSDIKRS